MSSNPKMKRDKILHIVDVQRTILGFISQDKVIAGNEAVVYVGACFVKHLVLVFGIVSQAKVLPNI